MNAGPAFTPAGAPDAGPGPVKDPGRKTVRTASVRYPVVGAGVTEFAAVTVERFAQKDHHDDFFVAPFPPIARKDLQEALMAGRAGEPALTRFQGVLLDFIVPAHLDVHGRSCELAAVIADKRARLRPPPASRRIIATGKLRQDRSGLLDPIDGFQAKCRGVVEEAGRTAAQKLLFCFPAVNFADLDEPMRAALNKRETQGRLELRPAEQLSDLEDLWLPAPAPVVKSRLILGLSAIGAVALATGLGAAGFHVWREAPVWRCAQALEAGEAGEDRALARAAQLCLAATDQRPASGRAHFLLASVYAQDGARVLARRHWRRAAMLGDLDGMISWGWLLWVEAGGEAERAEALDWMRAAAQAGHGPAMERLAIALREPDTSFTDIEEAEQWWRRAYPRG
ncbi:MAG: hypothetical protein RIA71_02160 [Oceanicaulis sp.]